MSILVFRVSFLEGGKDVMTDGHCDGVGGVNEWDAVMRAGGATEFCFQIYTCL